MHEKSLSILKPSRMSQSVYIAIKIQSPDDFQLISCNHLSSAQEVLRRWESEFKEKNPNGTSIWTKKSGALDCLTLSVDKVEASRYWLMFTQEVKTTEFVAKCYIVESCFTSDLISQVGECKYVRGILRNSQ